MSPDASWWEKVRRARDGEPVNEEKPIESAMVLAAEYEAGRSREKPPCGGARCRYAVHDGQRIESHWLSDDEKCPDHPTNDRQACYLHGGVHYRQPVRHSVIRDIRDPGLAGGE